MKPITAAKLYSDLKEATKALGLRFYDMDKIEVTIFEGGIKYSHGIMEIVLKYPETDQPAVSQSIATCRGSLVLGSGCGKCAKCQKERNTLKQAGV